MTVTLEEDRLNALHGLGLLDTPSSENFDRITRMASLLVGAPISAISLTDQSRQWFKSYVGMENREIPRLQAPCAEISTSRCSLLVPDLLDDPRFATSPLAEAGIRFYAGTPLVTREGYGIGAMCVLDRLPRTISPEQMQGLEDLAAMVMKQIELQHNLGRMDPLSGLPNRHQMAEDLTDLTRRQPDAAYTLLLIDLTNTRHFNQIASVLGTSYVDALMLASSCAVRDVLGRRVKLYHVGVAAYAALLDETAGPQWRDAVSALTARLREPIWCNGIPVALGAFYGTSSFRLGEASPDDVLRTAISAAYDAREAEFNHASYNPARDEANRRRFTLLTDIRAALEASDQLRLVYQPRIDLRTGACVSVEALLRWQHPVLGNVAPGEFIPLVEQTALVRSVTAWVIGTALKQALAWQAAGQPLRISINVSASNLEEEDFARRLGEALHQRGLPPAAVELELTESALIRNGSRVLDQLAEIKAMGIEIAIDDFGTGYSTFAYLRRLPASTVKLDRSFIRGIAGNTRDQMLLQSMISMAHQLGYRVVAEGVETKEALDFLAKAACDEVQGYFISCPIAADALDHWLGSNRQDQVDQRAAGGKSADPLLAAAV